MEQQRVVLLVEDNPADVYLIGEAIRQAGITARILVVGDGEKAVRHLEREDDCPAVIVLDYNLPKKTGYQVLEYVRASPCYKRTPVILFTSALSGPDRIKVDALGVAEFLLKSLDLDEYNRIGPAIQRALDASTGLAN